MPLHLALRLSDHRNLGRHDSLALVKQEVLGGLQLNQSVHVLVHALIDQFLLLKVNGPNQPQLHDLLVLLGAEGYELDKVLAHEGLGANIHAGGLLPLLLERFIVQQREFHLARNRAVDLRLAVCVLRLLPAVLIQRGLLLREAFLLVGEQRTPHLDFEPHQDAFSFFLPLGLLLPFVPRLIVAVLILLSETRLAALDPRAHVQSLFQLVLEHLLELDLLAEDLLEIVCSHL